MTGNIGDRATVRRFCNPVLSRQLTDQVIEVGSGFALEHAARKRRDPAAAARAAKARWKGRAEVKMRGTHERPLVRVRQLPHAESSLIVRRYMALLCCIFEQADLFGDNRGRAAGAGVFLGHTRTRPGGGAWAYLPKDAQGGIAARLKVDVRTVEQMIAVLVHGRILKAWQPPAFDRETGVALPRGLRGETYAYQMYALVGGLPSTIVGHLRRWEGIDRQRDAESSPARVDGAELGEGSPLSREELEHEAATFLKTLRGRGSGPPS